MPINSGRFNYENYFVVGSLTPLTPRIKKVIFNDPATIVIWEDSHEKTVVKCMDGDTYDPEIGLAMCIAKRVLGKKYKHIFNKYRRQYEDQLMEENNG